MIQETSNLGVIEKLLCQTVYSIVEGVQFGFT